MQEDRKSGREKGKAKFRPLGAAAPDHQWAAFWQEEHEEAFKTFKRLVENAVELQVPDMEGSRSGNNPFHLWVDACAYGVGASLFQGPYSETAFPADNHHTSLRLSTWCTKQEVERRYLETKI